MLCIHKIKPNFQSSLKVLKVDVPKLKPKGLEIGSTMFKSAVGRHAKQIQNVITQIECFHKKEEMLCFV